MEADSVMKLVEYKDIVSSLKSEFKKAQIKASVRVNSELLGFYWLLGSRIIEIQAQYTWGSKFLENLSQDLSREFPDVKGFSKRNLELIRKWVLFWDREVIAKQVVSQLLQIPWGHNIAIIQKCKNIDEAIYYVSNTAEHGISRNVLIHQIESRLFEREAKAVNNFSLTLPPQDSDMASEITKDPYLFDFLTMTDDYKEKELEDGLVDNIKDFLLELGSGFAFVGKQYKLEVGDSEYRIDLLFYHIGLHRYVVVELKNTKFKPEYAGKLSFYISAVDGEVKSEEDNATIGILICKSKDDLIVEYVLKDIHKPMGVSEYRLTNELPESIKSSLPTIEQLEEEIGK